MWSLQPSVVLIYFRFGNHPINNAEVAWLWNSTLQSNDHVVPIWIRSLRHIGCTWVCLGVGVTVHYSNNVKPRIFRVSLNHKVLLGIDGVHARGLRRVVGGVELECRAARAVADEEPARLIRVTRNRVTTDLIQNRLRDVQRA